MHRLARLVSLAAGILACPLTLAQAPVKSTSATTAQSATTATSKPANATGQCRDGSYSTDATRSGACRGHHGVKEWYAAATPPASPSSQPAAAATPASDKPAPPTTPAAPVSPSPTTQVRTQGQAAAQSAGQSDTPPATQSITPPQPTSAPAAVTAKAPTSTRKGPKADLANTPAAPGGGPGLVWVNSASNVYHCPGTDFYGKTKKGAYMTEADAKAKGIRANRGQTCPR